MQWKLIIIGGMLVIIALSQACRRLLLQSMYIIYAGVMWAVFMVFLLWLLAASDVPCSIDERI
jgi:hypothetical protein